VSKKYWTLNPLKEILVTNVSKKYCLRLDYKSFKKILVTNVRKNNVKDWTLNTLIKNISNKREQKIMLKIGL